MIFEEEHSTKKISFEPSKVFENFVLILIIISSITLIADNPLYKKDEPLMEALEFVDNVITFLFICEAFIKIIAKGLLFNNMEHIEPYLRNNWNVLDAIVVLGSIINLGFMILGVNMDSLSALKALRALRGLRPLRMISRNEGMRLVVNALLASLPSMKNVLLVSGLFILIFTIIGVNLFKGTFNNCQERFDSTSEIDLSLIITKQDCLD